MLEDVAGAILAAGSGERLRKAVAGLPKPLVELGGDTLLGRQARAMIDAGVHPLMAVINSETAELIEARGVELPSELELRVRDTANSMETLFAVGEILHAGRCLLATVDAILPRPEFKRFALRASELTALKGPLDGALGVVRWRGDRRPLFAEVGEDGLIGALGDRKTPWVTAGVYLFSTAIFRFVDQARIARLGAMREFLALLVNSGMRVAAIELADAIDIDEAQDLQAASAMLATHGDPSGARARSVSER